MTEAELLAFCRRELLQRLAKDNEVSFVAAAQEAAPRAPERGSVLLHMPPSPTVH
jgi:hypothetical protein